MASSVRANKLMVARSAGAGSVVGYNYMDMGYINTNGAWIEVGLNASHMVGSHHVLFEGNYGHNADSDNTHGNSIYHTFFRNHLRGIRAPFENQAGGRIDDAAQSRNGPKRCAGLMAYSYWMSFVGNVLGRCRPDERMGLRDHFRRRQARHLDAGLGWGEALSDRRAGRRHHASPRQFRLRHQRGEMGSGHRRPRAAGLALPEPEAGLLRCRERLHLAMGRPGGRDEAARVPAKARYDAGTPFTQP